MSQIAEYDRKLQALAPSDTGSSFQDTLARSAGIHPPLPEPPVVVNDTPDPWTKISLAVSSSFTADAEQDKGTSYSVGGSVYWGLNSVGGSFSNSSQSTDAARQMATSSIKVSFECMRVDINRGWLRGELFYDDGLKATKDK